MSPQQDVSVRDLLAAGPAVSAICTPPDADADEPEQDSAPSDEELSEPAEQDHGQKQDGSAT